jgi:hypothetical protein
VTVDGVWIGNRISGHFNTQLVDYSLEITITDKRPQSRFLVAPSNGGHSSASGISSLQDGDSLTPTSYSSHCRLGTLS